ncbi:hypothetical protein niasHS_015314 [Heterodera schachtii]|uniref:B30.2/SPRY domain-containing protein n=1 Tax=Heterodera schachtii TaxID=97005 RepID=A0ABD2I318_HETSC
MGDIPSKQHQKMNANHMNKEDKLLDEGWSPTQKLEGGELVAPTEKLGGDGLVALTENLEGGELVAPTEKLGGDGLVAPTENLEGAELVAPTKKLGGDGLVAPTENLGGDGLVAPTEKLEGGELVAPTEKLGGDGLVAPTENLEGGELVAPTEKLGGDGLVAPTENLGGDGLVAPTENLEGDGLAQILPPKEVTDQQQHNYGQQQQEATTDQSDQQKQHMDEATNVVNQITLLWNTLGMGTVVEGEEHQNQATMLNNVQLDSTGSSQTAQLDRQMNDLHHLVVALTERLDENVSVIVQLRDEVKASEEKQTTESEQQRKDKAQLEQRIWELRNEMKALEEKQTKESEPQRMDKAQLEQRIWEHFRQRGEQLDKLEMKLAEVKRQKQKEVAELIEKNGEQSDRIWQLEQRLELYRNTSKYEFEKVNNVLIRQQREAEEYPHYLQHMVQQCSQSMADLRKDKVRENTEQRTQQQRIDKLTKTVDELGEAQKGICAKMASVANSVGILKERIPSNRWDPNACHRDLSLCGGSERLLVQHNGEEPGFRSVFAKWAVTKIHCNSFYFEIKVIDKLSGDDIIVGLGPKHVKLDKCMGNYKCTYAYDSNGNIWLNGCRLKHRNRHSSECAGGSSSRAFVGKRVPLWGAGDVVGCGVNLSTRQLMYTKNGERIDASNLFADSVDLFACVTLYHPGDKIEANFGSNFKYNFEADI